MPIYYYMMNKMIKNDHELEIRLIYSVIIGEGDQKEVHEEYR